MTYFLSLLCSTLVVTGLANAQQSTHDPAIKIALKLDILGSERNDLFKKDPKSRIISKLDIEIRQAQGELKQSLAEIGIQERPSDSNVMTTLLKKMTLPQLKQQNALLETGISNEKKEIENLEKELGLVDHKISTDDIALGTFSGYMKYQWQQIELRYNYYKNIFPESKLQNPASESQHQRFWMNALRDTGKFMIAWDVFIKEADFDPHDTYNLKSMHLATMRSDLAVDEYFASAVKYYVLRRELQESRAEKY